MVMPNEQPSRWGQGSAIGGALIGWSGHENGNGIRDLALAAAACWAPPLPSLTQAPRLMYTAPCLSPPSPCRPSLPGYKPRDKIYSPG